jgi:hypothetical protein
MLTEKQKKVIWAGISSVPQVIACLMLLWALKPRNPYGYYILLRWVCCAVFAYATFQALARQKRGWSWALGITAAVYNPIAQVHLTKGIWSIVNIIAIGIAVASVFAVNLRDEKNKTGPAKAAEEAERWEPADEDKNKEEERRGAYDEREG